MKQLLALLGAPNDTVVDVLPMAPPMELQPAAISVFTSPSTPLIERVVDVVTIICCFIGICGNSWFMYRTLSHCRRHIHHHNSTASGFTSASQCTVSHRSTLGDRQINAQRLCLVILSLIGLIDSGLVGVMTVDNFVEVIGLNTVICKIGYFVEGMCRVYSPLVITVISFDRYIYGRQMAPITAQQLDRHRHMVVIALSLFLLLSILLVTPHTIISVVYQYNHNTLTICDDIGDSWASILYEFLGLMIAYVGPLVAVVVVYGMIIKFVWAHVRRTRCRSTVNITSVAGRSMTIVVFYFMCWTPYWLTMAYNLGEYFTACNL